MAKSSLFAVFAALIVVIAAAAQPGENKYNSQEISESDGVPVLMKHLPDYEQIRGKAVFARDVASLKPTLGDRPELDMIDFSAGTEAVTAPYDAGKLLIVEYASPQASVEADGQFQKAAAANTTIAYRRIGNYNVLVFDVTDAAAANALIDQVRYEKQIQWLGNNPFRISAERAFVMQTADLFLSTVYVILAGVGIALLGGLISGIVYFQLRERRRAAMTAYTDAGGMTRLNLDGFTPDVFP
jgi:hypothetical protein